jgi:hypothetical protein
MTFPRHLKRALDSRLGTKVKYFNNWQSDYTGAWKGPGGMPVGLVLHHTAGAATDSTDSKHPGNQPGANSGVVNFVQTHFRVPAANFTLDRDGTVYVHAASPVWHAGEGTFVGKPPWSSFGIPQNDANRWMLGVEVVSKGRKKDYTKAQIDSLVALIRACRDAAEWNHTGTKYLPRHKDWAGPRKVDIVYDNNEVQGWIAERSEPKPPPAPTPPPPPPPPTPQPSGPLWDGKVPDYDAIIKAQNEGTANPAAHRLACRLADLGFFKGTPAPRYEQGYPRRAVRAYQEHHGFKVPVPGNYGPVLHKRLFGERP